MDKFKKFLKSVGVKSQPGSSGKSFRKAGEGKKLTDSPSHGTASGYQAYDRTSHIPPDRAGPSASAKRAYDAALNRKKDGPTTDADWGKRSMANRLKRELEQEARAKEEAGRIGSQIAKVPDHEVIDNVQFFCTLNDETTVGTYQQIEEIIKDFLYDYLKEEPYIAAAMIIHSCNPTTKIEPCVEVLRRCITNIEAHPEEDKYKRIRKGTKTYTDKLAPVLGVEEYLRSIGFIEEHLPYENGTDTFWVFVGDISTTVTCMDILLEAEPLRPQLHRSLKVWFPDAVPNEEVPDEFFDLSREEILREQQSRTEEVELNQMLLTQATRQKLKCKDNRKYRYTTIRIRLPEGTVLQASFKGTEKFDSVLSLVRENLSDPQIRFTLSERCSTSPICDDEKTLHELKLVPNAVLLLRWIDQISDDQLPLSVEAMRIAEELS